MSIRMSYDSIRKYYIRKGEVRNPGKGGEIGESYIFLRGKFLFMKHELGPKNWNTS